VTAYDTSRVDECSIEVGFWTLPLPFRTISISSQVLLFRYYTLRLNSCAKCRHQHVHILFAVLAYAYQGKGRHGQARAVRSGTHTEDFQSDTVHCSLILSSTTAAVCICPFLKLNSVGICIPVSCPTLYLGALPTGYLTVLLLPCYCRPCPCRCTRGGTLCIAGHALVAV